MDAGLLLLGLVLALFLLLAIGVPVAFAFLIVNVAGLYFLVGPRALSLLSGSAYSATANFSLAPVPLFILMGELLLKGGVATRTMNTVDVWIGRVPGRLALGTVAAGAILGSVSGSSMASVATLGSSTLAEMEKRNYDLRFSISSILASGGLAVLIPPSMLAVILGTVAKVSIGQLLLASIIPGLLLALIYAVYYFVRAWLQPVLAPAYVAPPTSVLQKLLTLLNLLPLAVLMLVVTGLIFLGIATPSETAALGVVATLAILIGYRSLSYAVLKEAIMSSVVTTAMIFIILVGSSAYSQLLAMTGVISGPMAFFTELDLGPVGLTLILMGIIFVLGCFLDTISIILLLIPVFMPVALSVGADPIWLCVIILINLELAGITPPFGVLLFVMQGVRPQTRTKELYSSVFPIVIIQITLMLLVLAVPSLATWLPAQMRN
ncbi:MAG: TRAP transporter large permease subunit [Rhizobiaceae bacterium]